jgi:hypothetical protein
MVSHRSRSLLPAALVVVVGIAAEWTWSRTRNASLVERMLWGAIVLAIVYSQRAKVWLIETLDGEYAHQSDFSVEDRWFGPALRVWLFPLGLALIAESLAQSDSVRYPAGVALAVMFTALLAWSVFVLAITRWVAVMSSRVNGSMGVHGDAGAQ